MMNTAPAAPVWQQLRLSLPEPAQIRAFLDRGAVMAWSEDCWIIAWGEAVRADRPDPERPSFYAPDFFLREEKPWRIFPHAAAVSPDSLAQMLHARDMARRWEPFDEKSFAAAFTRVTGEFRGDRLQKAVPAVFETSRGALTAAERERALRNLANLPAGLMPYGFWDEKGGALGASPELLFEDDGVEIHTVAVAGTARSGAMPEAMMDDPKERNEHRLVLEDVAAQIAPLGHVTRGTTRLWRIGMLSHLRTDLRVLPQNRAEFSGLVARLHPTPAVGVAPRGDWRSILPAIDGGARRYFSAPFGLALPGGRSRCLVAIRGVQWDAKTTRCGAGCGLVPGSDLAREMAELRLKLSATRGNLGF